MIQVDNKIISLDVFEKHFICDLNACKGACCVDGDAGAPLLEKEVTILEDIYEQVKPYMVQKGIDVVDKLGVAVLDSEGEVTTPLVNNRECAFVIEEKGISKCAIEKAQLAGKVDFKKPISCHLYPIRVQEYSEFSAVNYHKWPICDAACSLGNELKVPVYKFTKEALIRKFGLNWFLQLEKLVSEL